MARCADATRVLATRADAAPRRLVRWHAAHGWPGASRSLMAEVEEHASCSIAAASPTSGSYLHRERHP
jgi:hypothetical protein